MWVELWALSIGIDTTSQLNIKNTIFEIEFCYSPCKKHSRPAAMPKMPLRELSHAA